MQKNRPTAGFLHQNHLLKDVRPEDSKIASSENTCFFLSENTAF